MPIELEIPDLGILEFPDDISRDELESTLARLSKIPPKPTMDLLSILSDMGAPQGAWQGATLTPQQIRFPEVPTIAQAPMPQNFTAGPPAVMQQAIREARLSPSFQELGQLPARQEKAAQFQDEYQRINQYFDAMLSAIPSDNIDKLAEIGEAKAMAIQDLNMRAQVAKAPYQVLGYQPEKPFVEPVGPEEYEKLTGMGGPVGKVYSGMQQFGAGFLEMLKDPLVIASLAPGVASKFGVKMGDPGFHKFITRLFGYQMLSHSPEAAKQVYESWKSGDVAGTTRDLLNFAVSSGLGAKLAGAGEILHPRGIAREWTEKANQRNQQLKEEYARRQQEAAAVYGDVRPQPIEGEGKVPTVESIEGVQPVPEAVAKEAPLSLDAEIAQLEIDPEVTGKRVFGTAPDGTPLTENVMTSQVKVNRLRDLKRMRDGGVPQSSELDVAVEEAEAELLSEAENMGKKVEPIELDEKNAPFATGRWAVPTPSGIGIYRPEFVRRVASWMTKGMTPEQIRTAIRAHVVEEVVHSHVTPKQARAAYLTSSVLERAMALFKYSGYMTRSGFEKATGTAMSEEWLGHEILRQKTQRMRGMTVSEVADAAGLEKWTTQGIQVLEDALAAARKRTRTSKAQSKILGKIQERLDAAKASVVKAGEEQPASMTVKTDLERQIDELPSDLREEIRNFFHQKSMNPAIDDAWRRVVREMQLEIPEGEEMPTEVQAAYVLTMFGGNPKFARDNPAMKSAWDNFRETVKREATPSSFPASLAKRGKEEFEHKTWKGPLWERYKKSLDDIVQHKQSLVDLIRIRNKGSEEDAIDEYMEWATEPVPRRNSEVLTQLLHLGLKELEAMVWINEGHELHNAKISAINALKQASAREGAPEFGPGLGPASFTKDPEGEARRRWEEIRKEQYGKRKKQMGTNITPLGFIKGGLFEGQPNIGAGVPGEHPTGAEFGLKPRDPLTAREIQEAAAQIANGPITFKTSKISWRRKARTLAEGEEAPAPKRSIDRRPSYRDFREWVGRNIVRQQVDEEVLRQIWKDAIVDELSNASPERAELWREAYGLEKVYGARPMVGPEKVGKITPSQAVLPETVLQDRKARAQVWLDQAQKLEEMLSVVPDIPKTRGHELLKQLKRKVRAYRANAEDIMAGKSLPLEKAEAAAPRESRYWKGGQLSSPEIYRSQVLTDVLRKQLSEMEIPEKTLDRESITISEVDFENDRVEFAPWLELSERDLNPERLAEIATDGARTSGEPITQSRVLLAMADKHGRGVQLVSVYPHGGSYEVTEISPSGEKTTKTVKSEVRATMPGLKALTRPNRPLREVMVNYRPFLRILLKEPVRNFHQSFKNMAEFNKAIGTKGRETAAALEWGEFAGEEYIPEEVEGKVPEGWMPEMSYEAMKGEGGIFMGEHADVARASLGIGKKPGLVQRRGNRNISASEANAVRSMIERNIENIESPDKFWEVIQALKYKYDNRTLSGNEWTTILALRKGARAIRRFYPWYTENEAIAQTLKSFYEAATKAKDEENYLARIISTFNEPAKDIRAAGPATPLFRQAPKSAGPAAEELARRFPTGEELKTLADIAAFEKQRTRVGARPEPISREVTMIPRRAPTAVSPANIPPAMVERMAAERAARQARPTEAGPSRPPPEKLTRLEQIALAKELKKARAEMEPTMPYYDIHKVKPAGGEMFEAPPFTPAGKRAKRVIHKRSEEQPGSFTKDVAERAKAAFDWMKSPVVLAPQAIDVDLSNAVPRLPKNISEALTRATGMERIPLIGKLWGPRATIKDAADREFVGYAVKRNMGNSISAMIGKELGDMSVRLRNPFKVAKDGQLLNVNADPKTSLYPSDVFERWQVETLMPELMRGVPGITDAEIAEYVSKNPKRYALTRNQDLMFRAIYEYVRDAYRYLDERKAALDVSDRKPQFLTGFSGDLAIYPLPRVALYKKSIGIIPREARRIVGESFELEHERLYPTEAIGAENTVYEPDMVKRVMTLLNRTYKAVADGELARAPSLQGKTVSEMRIELSKKHEAKLRSGEMELKSIEQMAHQGEKDISRSVLSAHPAFTGKVFPEAIASKLERAFGESAHHWVRRFGEISKLQKGFMLTADLAQFFQQGLPFMMRNPKMWGNAVHGSLMALNDPNVLGRVLRDPALRESAMIFVQNGGSIGHLQDFMSGAMPGEPAARVPGFRQLVIRSGQSFGTFLDLSKIYMFDSLRKNAPREQWASIAETVENIALSGRMEAAGLHPGRAFGERILFMATSYYRAALQLIAGAAEGAWRLAQGKGKQHIAQVESLKTLGSMMASLTLGMTAMYLASGMTRKEIQKRLTPGNEEFLMYPVEIGDRTIEIGFGGIIINLANLAGRVVDTAINNFSAFGKFGRENPFVWWLSTKLGPFPGIMASIYTGKDVLGRETGPVKTIGRTLVPISASSAIDVARRERMLPAAVESAAAFVGLRATTTGPHGQLRKIVDRYLKKSDDPRLRNLWENRRQQYGLFDSDYSRMRSALVKNDPKAFAREYARLLKIKAGGETPARDLIERAVSPYSKEERTPKTITGLSAKDERDLYNQMSPQEQRVFDAAKAERAELYNRFMEFRMRQPY